MSLDPPITLGTEAQTLERLRGVLTTARIAEQVTITAGQWFDDQQGCVDTIQRAFPDEQLIVRSSAPGEDTDSDSAAGVYTSILHVPATAPGALSQAVHAVIFSYTRRHGPDIDAFEILIQPMLCGVTCSGVAFTRDLGSMGPYLVINYDEGERTDTVTSGIGTIPRVVRVHHQAPTAGLKPPLNAVAATVRELTHLTGRPELDVEFAADAEHLYVLQVRPMPGAGRDHTANDARVAAEIAQVKDTLHMHDHPRPGLYGTRSAYSTMADWNPAEMIGAHPRTLALSLYQRLITREVWRDARRRLGYHDSAPHHLMVTLAGHPYVDLRADFTSYLPADLDDDTLDEHDRLLLLRYEENGGFWATPGGSLEPGEDHHSTALREVREELGVDDVMLGPELAVRSKDHLVGGKPVRQVERYYVARVRADDVDPAYATQPDEIRAWHWWTVAELAASDQTVYPIELGDLIAGYLRDGAPVRPLELAG